jgi:hypothetical protein
MVRIYIRYGQHSPQEISYIEEVIIVEDGLILVITMLGELY